MIPLTRNTIARFKQVQGATEAERDVALTQFAPVFFVQLYLVFFHSGFYMRAPSGCAARRTAAINAE
jgi:hypothetical protein